VTKVLSMLNEHTHDEILENNQRTNKMIRHELRNTEKYIQPVYSDIKLRRKCMYDKRRNIISRKFQNL